MEEKKDTIKEENEPVTDARIRENMRELLEKNLEINQEILKKTKYIKRFVIAQQIFGVIKLLLIVVPIVLGIMYLPSLFKSIQPMFDQTLGVYQELLGMKKGIDSGAEINPELLKKIPPEIIEKYLK